MMSNVNVNHTLSAKITQQKEIKYATLNASRKIDIYTEYKEYG